MKRFFDWIYSWFKKPAKKRRQRRQFVGEEISTQYRTIKSLLKDLDDVFEKIGMLDLRSHTQILIARYGVYLLSLDTEIEDIRTDRLDESFGTCDLPSFFNVYIHSEEGYARLITAKKLKNMGLYRAKPGYVYYDFGAVFPRRKSTEEDTVYVLVDTNTGYVEAVPMLSYSERVIRFRQKGRRMHERVSTPNWNYPNIIDPKKIRLPTEQQKKEEIEAQFRGMYNMAMRREFCVTVFAKKGGRKVVFSVPQNRWKYFFRDRIMTVSAADGRRKRIYHAVSAHYRKTRRGASPVRTHYRGTRHFFWRGYEIKIVMPGKHGAAHYTLNMTGQTHEIRTNQKMTSMTSGRIAKEIEKYTEHEAPLT